MSIFIYLFIIFFLGITGLILTIAIWTLSKKAGCLGIFMLMIVSGLIFICVRDRKQDINLEEIKYYQCNSIIFDNNYKKNIFFTPEKNVIVDNKQLMYPDNMILKEYKFIAKKGLVDWGNGERYRYIYILPNDEEYEKAKNNISNVEIITQGDM